MGRLGKVTLLLSFFALLGILHSTVADYDYTDYDDSFEGLHEDGHEGENDDHDYREEDADDGIGDTSQTSKDPSGSPPSAGAQNQKLTPMCNNENCWIRVDWEPPPRDTWMSCLLGYRVGFQTPGHDLIWMSDEGTHIDVKSDKLFFFEEAEGTNHSLTIRNLDYKTECVVIIEVFNPYGSKDWIWSQDAISVTTPSGSLF